MRRIFLLLAIAFFALPGLFSPEPAHALDQQEVCYAIQQQDKETCSAMYSTSSPSYTACTVAADSRYASCLQSNNPAARWNASCAERRAGVLSACVNDINRVPTSCDPSSSNYYQNSCQGTQCDSYGDACTAAQQSCVDDSEAAAESCDMGPAPAVEGLDAPNSGPTEDIAEEQNQQVNGSNQQTGPVSNGYQQIMEHGIIFANICPAPNIRVYDPADCNTWTSEEAAAATKECTVTLQTSACACRDSGDCSVQDIMQVIVNIMTFILAISGTIVLVMFVYGGVRFLTAAGSKDSIAAGRKAIVAAVVGTVIIFSSYAIITAVLTVITGQEYGQDLEDVVDGQDFFETQN